MLPALIYSREMYPKALGDWSVEWMCHGRHAHLSQNDTPLSPTMRNILVCEKSFRILKTLWGHTSTLTEPYSEKHGAELGSLNAPVGSGS